LVGFDWLKTTSSKLFTYAVDLATGFCPGLAPMWTSCNCLPTPSDPIPLHQCARPFGAPVEPLIGRLEARRPRPAAARVIFDGRYLERSVVVCETEYRPRQDRNQ
jgi:hypothetical protein